MSKKIAVILSGSGVYDGSEINEVVLSLLSLEEENIEYQCFAPNINQHHVINHLTGDEMQEQRNVLIESARIVRGNVKPLSECRSNDYDGLLVPGGFGAAKNLSDFAFAGTDLTINEEVLAICTQFKETGKPAGYMCIAPAMLPKIYGENILCTIGTDEETAKAIASLGGKHEAARVNEVVIDKDNKVVTTPAYMLAGNLTEAHSGIKNLVSTLGSML